MNKLAKTQNQRKIVLRHGINDANYVVKPTVDGKVVICPFYATWYNMLERCYSHALHNHFPTYIGCTVHSSWLSFMTFRRWMSKQDWDDKCLDKDIIIVGNKHYSPMTCVFVSHEVNTLLNTNDAIRGECPLGVRKHRNSFQAQIRIHGKTKYLGRFVTPEQASVADNIAKAEYIRTTALGQTDPRIISALMRHAILYEDGMIK
ncbi:MAG: hypothetical protein COA96_10175 [SAR86 cluster bacterium]|uniref:AP2 domain-containing protein n=1 Tax=SAR86 cluster bacterium TaxID=2030880 RepID=A0A2A5AXX5_9GAMM|nr:MAG: hypothetical protein COA96_10175 [SAR86 cluster bacterium]